MAHMLDKPLPMLYLVTGFGRCARSRSPASGHCTAASVIRFRQDSNVAGPGVSSSSRPNESVAAMIADDSPAFIPAASPAGVCPDASPAALRSFATGPASMASPGGEAWLAPAPVLLI
ncbi:hypothetical protein Vafri_7509, partial [Volvox africanus]